MRRMRRQWPTFARQALRAAVALFLAASAVAGYGAGRAAASTAGGPLPTGLGGQNWTRIPTHAKVVALTFDAGGDANGVSSILSTLSQMHVRASFMLTGDFVHEFPAQARAMAAAGRVGDHSVSHPDFTTLSDAQIRWQVQQAESDIRSVTGAQPWPWFRFPFGAYTQHTISVVNSVGFVPVGWTVDTLGWKGTSGGQSVQSVVNRVLGGLQPGEIVLMHVGSNPQDHSTLDAAALPTIINALRARGYGFVTVDALRGLGYHVLTSNGGVHNFGAPWYGSATGTLPEGQTAVGLAADPATGGYWILKSNGGVANYNAPWYGSTAGLYSVTAIAGE